MLMVLLYLVSFAEVAICGWFLCKTAWKDIDWNKKKLFVVGICTVLLGIHMASNRTYRFFSPDVLLSGIIIMSIFSCVLVGKKILSAIESVAMYYIFVAFLDYFLGFVSMGILKKDFQELVLFHSPSMWRIGIYVCSRVTAVLLLLVLEKKMTCGCLMEYPKAVAVLCAAGFVVLCKYKEYMIILLYRKKDMVWLGACIPLFMILMSFVTIKMLHNLRKMKEYELLALKNKMLQKQYQEQEMMFQQKQKLLHDVKNHILTLQGLEQDGDLEGMHKYLQSLKNTYYNAGKTVQCNNHVLSIILNQEKEKAEQKDISFEIKELSFSELHLEDADVTVLFGNLLDNAVEACEKAEEGERWITVRIEQKKQGLFVEVTNTVAEIPDIENGMIVSTKNDRSVHGYGLKNIKEVVDRYEGVMHMEVRNNLFLVQISFFGG